MRRAAPFLAALAVALAAAGCSAGDDESAPPGTTTEATTTTVAESVSSAGGTLDFSDLPEIVEAVGPSVVTVFVKGAQGEGSGSGVIWDAEGRIVTNDHVIADARQVEVALANGTRLDARVLGTDPRTDLAVVDVAGDDLPAAEFAESLPRVGELALALGSPLGFTNTATAGIVSALHRDLPSGGQTPALVDLLQTDAAISPGNSGGALVNGDGVVIGINVAYIPPQAQAVAIGFAIPSPVVLDVVPQLIESGKAEHAYLGVVPTPVTEQLRNAFDLGVDEGALIRSVTEGTPAADAGLREGDVVVAIDGTPIRSVEDLYAAVRDHDPGDTVEVRIVRRGDRRTVELTLGRLPG